MLPRMLLPSSSRCWMNGGSLLMFGNGGRNVVLRNNIPAVAWFGTSSFIAMKKEKRKLVNSTGNSSAATAARKRERFAAKAAERAKLTASQAASGNADDLVEEFGLEDDGDEEPASLDGGVDIGYPRLLKKGKYLGKHNLQEMRVRIRRRLALMQSNPYIPNCSEEEMYEAFETFRNADSQLIDELLDEAPPMYAKRIHLVKDLLSSKILRLHSVADNTYEIFWDNGMKMTLKVDFGALNARFSPGGVTVRVMEDVDGSDNELEIDESEEVDASKEDQEREYVNTWNGKKVHGIIHGHSEGSPQLYEEPFDPAVPPGMTRFHMLPRLFLPPLELMSVDQAFREAKQIHQRDSIDQIAREKRYHIKPAVRRHLAEKQTKYKIYRAQFFKYLDAAREARQQAILRRSTETEKYW